ncbi:hypothetical protein V8F06_004256 [Rhypophila decipiens]
MEQQPKRQRERDDRRAPSPGNKQARDSPVSPPMSNIEQEANRDNNLGALSRRTPASDQQMLATSHQNQLHRPQAEEANEQAVAHADNGRRGAPAVRLDMDLDADVKMKGKIQGDVTLSILGGDQK